MGVFSVPISVGDTTRGRWQELSAVVDTGTFWSAVPGSILRDLGVLPTSRETGQLADGTEKEVDVAYTWLRFNGREVMTHIIYNEEYTSPLLGSLALENLMYVVDPTWRKGDTTGTFSLLANYRPPLFNRCCPGWPVFRKPHQAGKYPPSQSLHGQTGGKRLLRGCHDRLSRGDV